MTVGFNNNRVTTNQPFTTLSPTINSNFRFTLTQPLLQGFGLLPTTRFIRIAKNNREISDVAFRLQVITTVNQIQNIYWDLVNAYENVKVQQESLVAPTSRDLNNKWEKNVLLPSLGLFAFWGGTGLGGSFNPNARVCANAADPFCPQPADIPPSTSMGGTIGQLFDSSAPDKGI